MALATTPPSSSDENNSNNHAEKPILLPEQRNDSGIPAELLADELGDTGHTLSDGSGSHLTPAQAPSTGHTAPPEEPQALQPTPVAEQRRGLSTAPPVASEPAPQVSRDLDSEDIFADYEVNRTKFDEFQYQDKALNLSQYQGIGALSSEDVISKDYDKYYAHLEEKVVDVKTWLQETLSEQNRTEDIGIARKERGQKYVEMKTLLDQLLVRYFSGGAIVRNEDAATLSSMVINEMLGLGPIEPLWQDSRITEIMVNGPSKVRIEINGKLVTAKGVKFRDQDHLIETAQQILSPLGKTIDVAHPLEDGRLADGSRINVTHPVVGPGGPYLTIRRFPETVFSMKKLVEMGSMTEEMAVEIGNLVYHACSVVVSGGTGSGKTSMLNALSGCIPADERTVTIEDNLELRLHPDRDVIAMETRRSHQGERGNVTIRDLVRNSLRQRPDRIVVGEVRDGAAYDMLQAMNTGHEGSMTTVHANDAFGAIDRLVNLIAEVGELSSNQALSLISNGVDIIVSIGRFEDGSRRVESISEVPSRVTSVDGVSTLEPIPIFEFVQTDEAEDGTIIGEYRKVNDLSPSLIKKHRLDRKKRLSIEEIYLLSDQAPNS